MPDHYFTAPLAEVDPEIAQVLDRELQRQRGYLEMIASENFVPVSVLQSQGSVLTNKYAEGYPGRRYYGGCEEVDVAEELAIERAKSLFGAAFANVQPHSGATANAAVLHAITCMSGPPCWPGNTAVLIFFAMSASFVRMKPDRGPPIVLCTVEETTCACGTGLGCRPAATSPAKCAMSTQSSAPTSSAIARKAAKSS